MAESQIKKAIEKYYLTSVNNVVMEGLLRMSKTAAWKLFRRIPRGRWRRLQCHGEAPLVHAW